MSKKPLEIDMIAGSQLRDTQGEMLSVEGADISELEAGRGRFNDNHGKGFFNSIGRITTAKKIMKAEDCTDPRHEYYWNKVKSPFIYCKGLLYDDEDHTNAQAAAAILRNIHKTDCPLKLKASVEGGVTSRGVKDETLLARTKIHSVALTFTPANQATLVEPISLTKNSDWVHDEALIKSVVHLATTSVPSFREISRNASANRIISNLCQIQDILHESGRDVNFKIPDPEELIYKSIESKIVRNVEQINTLMKALTAGAHAGSPTSATGGSVLQAEGLETGFKYMTCSSCGKEQVYMKHQVKCRECGKHQSLKDLARLMIAPT